jgi:hypothetical protein
MKRKSYLIVSIAAVFGVLLIGVTAARFSNSSAQKILEKGERVRATDEGVQLVDQNAQQTPAFGQEQYTVSTVLTLDYGNNENQIGLIDGVEDFRPTGPLSFDVQGEAIYILDEVNDQVKAFNRDGALLRAVEAPHGSTDIAVDDRDRLYILDSQTNSVEQFEIGSLAPSHYKLDVSISRLSEEPNGSVSAKGEGSDEYRFNQWNGSITRKAATETFAFLITGDRSGKVINTLTGKAFQVATENQLGSLSYLGQDTLGNVYLVVEQLLPGDTIQVIKQVRKYAVDGRQIAEIPIDINYAAYPEKDLILSSDGSIYHLRPLKNLLVVEKFSNQN